MIFDFIAHLDGCKFVTYFNIRLLITLSEIITHTHTRTQRHISFLSKIKLIIDKHKRQQLSFYLFREQIETHSFFIFFLAINSFKYIYTFYIIC